MAEFSVDDRSPFVTVCHSRRGLSIFLSAIFISIFSVDVSAVTVLQPGSWPTDVLTLKGDVDQIQVFSGNSTVSDHFHQLHIYDDSLLLTARNVIYNISLETFTEVDRISWFSTDDDVRICLLRQKTKEECQNYIRVLARRSDGSFLVCGTNAFRPQCRTYSYGIETGFTVTEVESGVARCPYNPKHNSTAVIVGNRLYSATVADLSLRDAIIYSKPLRTEQHDSQWLNDPNFVSSFHHDSRVYFFFRETSVENINCGKTVFSRVARVCANDEGGARVLRNTWTSFFKARLNCSFPGEFPFFFDEIQSTSDLGNGSVSPTLILADRVPMVYGVFTTPRNSLPGSAICAFKMADIIASFEGPNKEQKTSQSNWLPVRDTDIPDPHPAKVCVNNSMLLSDQTLNFIKSHPLMDRAVPAFGGQPLFIQSSFEFSYTQITIDWQVGAADHLSYDVLFVGTDNGRVLKMINRGRTLHRPDPVVIEDIEVFSSGSPVTGLKIYRRESGSMKMARLVVMSRDEVRSVPLHRCHRKTTCADCVALKDPYCSWLNDKCVDSHTGFQSIDSGRHHRCPVHVAAIVRAAKGHELPTTAVDSISTDATIKTCTPCQCRDTSVTSLPAAASPLDVVEEPYIMDDSALSARDHNEDAESSLDNAVQDIVNAAKAWHSPVLDPCVRQSLDGASVHQQLGSNSLYSSGVVATITVICVVGALVIGFGAGYYVNSRRYLRCLRRDNDRLWNLVGKAAVGPGGGGGSAGVGVGGVKRTNQNPYEIDPIKYQYRVPAYDKCDTIIGGGGTSGRSTNCDDCCNDSFEPILQRNVGSRCIDEIKLNNLLRTPDNDDDDGGAVPRRPPRRNKSINRKEPDG